MKRINGSLRHLRPANAILLQRSENGNVTSTNAPEALAAKKSRLYAYCAYQTADSLKRCRQRVDVNILRTKQCVRSQTHHAWVGNKPGEVGQQAPRRAMSVWTRSISTSSVRQLSEVNLKQFTSTSKPIVWPLPCGNVLSRRIYVASSK